MEWRTKNILEGQVPLYIFYHKTKSYAIKYFCIALFRCPDEIMSAGFTNYPLDLNVFFTVEKSPTEVNATTNPFSIAFQPRETPSEKQ